MQFSHTIMKIEGCEVQVIAQPDPPSEEEAELGNYSSEPNVFIVVARNQRQLDFVFDNYTGAELKSKMLSTAPELRGGLPEGRIAVMVFIREEHWTTSDDAISIDPKTGVLNLRFYYTPDTTQSRGHILTAADRQYPLRIKAEFHDPFEVYTSPVRRSPHGKITPEGRPFN